MNGPLKKQEILLIPKKGIFIPISEIIPYIINGSIQEKVFQLLGKSNNNYHSIIKNSLLHHKPNNWK